MSEYCFDCDSNVQVDENGERVCSFCNPAFSMSSTQELDFSDNLFDRWEYNEEQEEEEC